MPPRLVYYVACTLDGFIARKDGSFNDCFLFDGEHFPDLLARFPETFPVHLREQLGVTGEAQRFDTVLMGRHTYEVGLRAGVSSPYAGLRQVVVSRSMGATRAVEVFGGNPVELVRRLKQKPGRDIWLCGGSKLAAALAPEIDELILKVNPFVIGEGLPLFAGPIAVRPARLLEHKAYPNGFVLVAYELK